MYTTRCFAAAFAVVLILGAGPASPAEPGKPNVVLILTDDQGWGDVRSHDNDLVDTPVHDRLASQGARFDRLYVSPVCAPTRASLLTGRYHLRSGVHGVTRAYETMRAEEVTVAEVFRSAGYATGCFGKWHNGAHFPNHPNGQGFEEFVGFCGGHWTLYFDTRLEHNGRPIKTTGYIADVLTDAALSFLRKNKDRPFLLYLPYNTPHSPFQVPDRYFDKYKARGLDDTLACVYGMVENIDDNLGRVLAALDELKLADDTVVVFTTDNGPNTERFNGGMRGRKGSVHEGGVRVPLFIRWPGHVRPGTTVTQIASHIDLLPTLVELCGVPMPETLPLDGVSLVPLLEGQTADWPDRMIFSHWMGGEQVLPNRGSVRSQRYRGVFERKGWQLYDMVDDPGETKDLAGEQAETLDKLRAAYDAWFADVTRAGFDPIPVPVGHPERPLVVLPGHEAFLHPAMGEGISYGGRAGWANDWVANWTSLDSYPRWEVDVVRGGRYEITLMYVCPAADVGSKIRVEVGGKSLEGVVREAYDPPPIPRPDRVPLKEAMDRLWAPLPLGTVELPKGRTQLAVKAVSLAGRKVMDLKAVRLRRVE
ncbi:MAG: arylsulfatase [Planctomycetota bacterium]